MVEQTKLEASSNQPPPHTDPHHAINIPDSGSVDSANAPTHGYLPGHQTFPIIKKDSATAPTQGYPLGHQTFPSINCSISFSLFFLFA
jgi:hypothetical protein